jgi:dimethylargininase
VLRLPARLIVNAANERTNALLAERGLDLLPVDIGEFGKAEAGLTCLSLVFATARPE